MKKVAALLALALAAAALVACGDDDGTTTTTETGGEATNGAATGGAGATGEGGAGGGGSTVQFEADPAGGLAYTTDTATAKAGSVTIEFTNPQAVPHDVALEDSSGKEVGKTDIVTESSATATADLKPGKYTFFCTVPGHREAGMEGTLTAQ